KNPCQPSVRAHRRGHNRSASARDALRRDLAGRQAEQPVEKAAQANREPFFSESASRRLLTTNRRKKLLEEIHARWLLAIGEVPFPAFDSTAWLNTLHRVAREASSEHLDQITLQEWLDAESPSAQKTAERLKNLVRESRCGIHAPPTVCFVPENWATHRGVSLQPGAEQFDGLASLTCAEAGLFSGLRIVEVINAALTPIETESLL